MRHRHQTDFDYQLEEILLYWQNNRGKKIGHYLGVWTGVWMVLLVMVNSVHLITLVWLIGGDEAGSGV